MVKIHLPMQEMWVQSLGWEDPRRKKWQPTPVFLPGKLHGQRSLAGYSPWGCKELDMTEWAHTSTHLVHNLVLCVFPFKDTVFNTYCWFMNIELTTSSTVTHGWKKLIWHITALLCLGHQTAFQCCAQKWEKRGAQWTTDRTPVFSRSWNKKVECQNYFRIFKK